MTPAIVESISDRYIELSEQLMNFLKQTAPVVEQYSIDEAFCDMTGTGLLYGDPVAFAHQLKDDILNRFGFTVNIGISTNKLLAKMASNFKKPNLVHTLFPEEIPQKMWPLPVGELFFVGPSMCKKLEALGIHTIGDVAASNPKLLVSHFKKHGELIWNYANGGEDSIKRARFLDNGCTHMSGGLNREKRSHKKNS